MINAPNAFDPLELFRSLSDFRTDPYPFDMRPMASIVAELMQHGRRPELLAHLHRLILDAFDYKHRRPN